MRLSVAVVGHISRREQAEALAASLSAELFMDDGSYGELPNHDRAWEVFDPAADFHVVLEDDALPVDNFIGHVTDALVNIPSVGACSFYTGTTKPRNLAVSAAVELADANSVAWLSSGTSLWGPCLALPTEHVAPMLRFVQRFRLPYDTRFGRYLKHSGLPCYYTNPSLVDHADGPSLLGHDGRPRKARRVGVPERWDTAVIEF